MASPSEPQTSLSFGVWIKQKLKKLRLLLWKNSLIERRKPLVLIFELLLPLIIPTILVLVRSTIDVTVHSEPTVFRGLPLQLSLFPQSAQSDVDPNNGGNLLFTNEEYQSNLYNNNDGMFDFDFNCTNFKLVYSPSTNERAALYVENVVNSLPCLLKTVVGYKTEEDVENALSYSENPIKDALCAVVFNEASEDKTDYKLRFPYSLRFAQQDGRWSTEKLYPSATPNGPRNPSFGSSIEINISALQPFFPNSSDVIDFNSFGGLPSYYLEGFSIVQSTLDRIIMSSLGIDTNTFKMQSRRFPYPPYTQDNFVTVLENLLSNLFLLCFVFMTFNIVKNLVVEKEKRLKESMKIMGLENYLHWTAWFIQYFFLTVIVVSTTTLFMCAKFSDYKVLPNSDWTVIFVFLLLYGTSSMMLCFLLSTLFSKANVAAVVATLVWFLTYLPWLIVATRYDDLSEGTKLLSCLLCNTGMSLGSYLIGQYEASGVGAQWSLLTTPVNTDDNVSLLNVFMMLIVDIILYGVMTWYIEAVFPGSFGYPQKFYFMFQKSYWLGSADVADIETDADVDCSDMYIEEEPQNVEKGIEIKGLRKVFPFPSKVAVNNLYLNLYRDEITVLLGHNGAGKSTTMSMLTGLFPPTSGNAIVNGYKLNGQLGQVRESLGLCPQHDVLFDQLTVEEHLVFFGSLKGATMNELKFEIPSLLEQLQLDDKIFAPSSTLSGGMKRKLSVGIALIGGSKVVILDEPTSGMDPAARRLTWDVLLGNKANRTIMLTTHFMDEADVLGDRIAIMADGKLQCCGSSLFLKNKYGVGYQLSVVKRPKCDVSEFQKAVQSIIPGAYIERNAGNELLFTLPTKFVKSFHELFVKMEEEQDAFGIDSFGVSVTTIEEVFLRVGKLYEDEATDTEGRHYSFSGMNHNDSESEMNLSMNSQSINFDNNDESAKYTSWYGLWWQQFYSMVIKRILHSVRNKKLGIVQILIPAFCVSTSLLVIKIVPTGLDAPNRIMELDPYSLTKTLYSVSGDRFKPYGTAYEDIIKQNMFAGSSVMYQSGSIEKEIIKRAEDDLGSYNTEMMIAAEFGQDIIAWYNNQAFHTAALSINLVSNAILAANKISHTITTSNHPLPPTLDDSKDAVESGAALWQGFNIAFNVAFGFAFLVASFVIFPVKERSSKSKHLQYVSGLHPVIFWLSAFAWDFFNFIVACIILIILFAIFQVDAYSGARLLYVSLIFCEYSIAALPLTYCCSFMFTDSTSAFVRCTTINIILSVGTMLTVVILKTPGIDQEDLSNALAWVFLLLVPQYCLPISLVDLYTNYEANDYCVSYDVSQEDCKEIFGDQVSSNYFSWERPGVSRYCVFYLLHSVVWWTILVCIESNFVQLWKNKFSNFRAKLMGGGSYNTLNNETDKELKRIDNNVYENKAYENGTDDVNRAEHVRIDLERANNIEDADVIKEANFVQNDLSHVKDSSTLVVDGLSKTFYQSAGNASCKNPCGSVNFIKAVKEMYLTVAPSECFGLLGVNGAGKTTTFKMLTGDVSMSKGTAYIKGLDISKNIKKAQQMMGYCPQFDALIDQMTGRETLRMFARLRGLKTWQIESCIDELLLLLDLKIHADKMTKDYSGGNKRKLSTAIAMVGLPPLVFLDEPTTGMDPAARRSLWKVLLHLVRNCSLSIILTSHSMEECEYLCSRLAIMVNGQFQCLGSPQHLKSRFGQGFTLIAKLEQDSASENKRRFNQFISEKFPNSILKDEHQTMIQYQVITPDLKWSEVFQTMEDNKEALNIVDYSVSQTSLEQVFLNFARNQAQ